MNKQELILQYAEWLLERMSTDDLCEFFVDTMCRDMDDWTMNEVLTEVKEYAPELMEDEE